MIHNNVITKVLPFKFFISILLAFLMLSCQNQVEQSIVFVQKGVPSDLEVFNFESDKEGYLVAEDEYSLLTAKKAIFGDDIALKIDLSVSGFDGTIRVIFGANTFSIINNSDENGIFLHGASIGKSTRLGEVSDYLQQNIPFQLTISYDNEILTYKIDNNTLYSEQTPISPAGLMKIIGEKNGFKISDIFFRGESKSFEDFFTKEFLLNRAHKSVEFVASRIKNDPNRPSFHFQPPANWNNDPNGLIYYDNYYHLFYQHNPYGDHWDWMHWGHARSKDLVHWEHLPIALWPSIEKNERHVFSGSGFIKDDGSPVLFYTSIDQQWKPEQWLVTPVDNSLFQWEKYPANPVMSHEIHNGQKISSWRDPFLFRDNGKTYMVNGGHPADGKGSIMLYEALNQELTDWKFLGVPFSGNEKNWECPNFFKIGDKYVLIYSPHDRVKYYTGTMDFENIKFKPDYHGVVDYGSRLTDDIGGDLSYYAPNTLLKQDGRKILFGWIPGFKKNQGWHGAISLPRELSIDSKGRLIQKPVTELETLRGELKSYSNINIGKNPEKISVRSTEFEMLIKAKNKGSDHIGIRLLDETGEPFEINISPELISVGKEETNLDDALDEKIDMVHLFFDNTIMEIFVNDGLLCATKVIYPNKKNLNFEIFSTSENTILESIDFWELNN